MSATKVIRSGTLKRARFSRQKLRNSASVEGRAKTTAASTRSPDLAVGNARDGDVGDGRVAPQDGVDLDGAELHPVAVDRVGEPSFAVEIAVGVGSGQVPRAQPTRLHVVGGQDEDLAHLADLHRDLGSRPDDTKPHAGQRAADRAEPAECVDSPQEEKAA